MKLIYRGQITESIPRSMPTYHKPNAVNWRYQNTGEVYNNSPKATHHFHQPRAMNWRYQMTVAKS